MQIKTKEFQEAANKILFAVDVDKNAANLEIAAKNGALFLNVTNKEYYVSVKFSVDSAEEFRAVVDASLFLNLISGFTSETFDLSIKDNVVLVSSGKSNYKLAMIFDNDKLMTLPVIKIDNKTVTMNISNDILMSILNVNSKELLKTKNRADVDELQHLYYIDETGCLTFTIGACWNTFSLEKPVKLLLNDRVVKLFKLFSGDVAFSFGHDPRPDGTIASKVSFETPDIYVAAIITNDDILLNKVQGPYNATKRFLSMQYADHAVISVPAFDSAISRLMMFTKNSAEKANMAYVPATVSLNADELTINDGKGNTEIVSIENESAVGEDCSMKLNLFDLKLVLDSCRGDHITLNCDSAQRAVVINRGTISNLIPKLREEAKVGE